MVSPHTFFFFFFFSFFFFDPTRRVGLITSVRSHQVLDSSFTRSHSKFPPYLFVNIFGVPGYGDVLVPVGWLSIIFMGVV